jgi:hypothetical protein
VPQPTTLRVNPPKPVLLRWVSSVLTPFILSHPTPRERSGWSAVSRRENSVVGQFDTAIEFVPLEGLRLIYECLRN